MSESQVIGAAYARVSTNMQNEKSPDDQVRVCRDRARSDSVIIPDDNVFIDRAVSGTKPDRDALADLKATAKAKRFSILYFEDLSRLGRESTHLMALLKELVFEGIRIISVNEGIDSANESWHILATILGLQHEQYIRDLGHRVRRGQAGAVLDDLSAGDICFGYASEPVPGTEGNRRVRNRRPRMRIIKHAELAHWVVRIFIWFAVSKKSMNWIADELTRLNVPKDHRATTKGWHHTYVKKILNNEKYVGIWKWGRSRAHRNPTTGKVKQVATPSDEVIVRERPDLRIVPQGLWDDAQARLRQIKKVYPGPNGAAGNRGSSYVTAYPKHEFAGLCFCAKCNARFVVAGSNGKYLACGGRRARRCEVRTHAPRALLRSLLIEQLKAHLFEADKCVDDLLQAVHEAVQNDGPNVESTLAACLHERRRVEHSIANLVKLAEASGGSLQSISQRLAELEQRQAELAAEIRELEERCGEPVELLGRDWLLAQIHDLQNWLAAGPAELAEVLRAFTGGRVEMKAVIPPGKKRGYFEARFRGNVLAVVAERLQKSGDRESCRSARLLQRVRRESKIVIALKRAS